MHYSSFFQFAALATLTALVDVCSAAPQGPGFSGGFSGGFGRPGPNMGYPGGSPFQSPKPSLSSVCFTSSKAPATRGRPTTQYTTVTTCTTTSTVVVTTTVSPPPVVTTSTIITTSTTTGPTSTDTATTSVLTTTTEMTTLPVSNVGTVITVTQTISVTASGSPFKNAVDTLPTATFSKRQRLAGPPGTSPNMKFKLTFGNMHPAFSGDVSCIVYQSECAVTTQTTTSTTTLDPTTVTSFATSTVVVTSIPIANITVTATSTATTTSTITPSPTTTTSTVTTTTTTTVQFDKCSPSNIVGGINGKGLDSFGTNVNWDGDWTSASGSTAVDCCRAVNNNPKGAVWVFYGGSCDMITSNKCSGIDQSQISSFYPGISSLFAPGNGVIVGNANCGALNSWTVDG